MGGGYRSSESCMAPVAACSYKNCRTSADQFRRFGRQSHHEDSLTIRTRYVCVEGRVVCDKVLRVLEVGDC